jgi:hypothetical protein
MHVAIASLGAIRATNNSSHSHQNRDCKDNQHRQRGSTNRDNLLGQDAGTAMLSDRISAQNRFEIEEHGRSLLERHHSMVREDANANSGARIALSRKVIAAADSPQ